MRVFPAIFYTSILEHMKKLHILIIIVVLVCVLLGFGIIHGFHDYPTQVIHSDQPNDSYLEALMKWRGYEGKKVSPPNPNLMESQRLTNRLKSNNYFTQPATPTIKAPSIDVEDNSYSYKDYMVLIIFAFILLFCVGVFSETKQLPNSVKTYNYNNTPRVSYRSR